MTGRTQLEKILGHEKIEKMLAKAIISGKIFPTWIFCGFFGVGKSSIAQKFAKCLLSGKHPQNESLDIDPDDRVHNLVNMRIHPDFFIIEQTEDSVSIDETRSLIQKIRKTPTLSKWRVVIIENASDLNKNIYNSLLKILEEPPKNTVIILICQNVGNIPKTLLSRAAKVSFYPIDNNLVQSALDNIGIDDSHKLAQLSDGSVGYAIHLQKNNGIEIYDNILKSLESLSDENMYRKSIQSLLDNNLSGNFRIVKEIMIRLLKLYVETLTGVIDYKKYPNEYRIFKTIVETKIITDIDAEVQKALEIISMLNKCDTFMLDKSVVLVYFFEKFMQFS